MTKLFNLGRDVTGAVAYSPPFADDVYRTTLAQNVEQNFTVPSNYAQWEAVFAIDPGLRVFIARNATATLPGSSFAIGAGELDPTARSAVNAGDTLSFITPDVAAYITVNLYAVK